VAKSGIKGNSGGKPGRSGRKSKAVELGLKALLDECWTVTARKQCLKALARKANGGEMEAIKLLFAYTFGKPTETKVHEIGDKSKPIIREIILERARTRDK
jgi:hypothetical protein